MDTFLGYLLGAAVTALLWTVSYGIFLACWRPTLASTYWLMVAKILGKRYFKLLRWGSPFLLAIFSLNALLLVARVFVLVRNVVAS